MKVFRYRDSQERNVRSAIHFEFPPTFRQRVRYRGKKMISEIRSIFWRTRYLSHIIWLIYQRKLFQETESYEIEFDPNLPSDSLIDSLPWHSDCRERLKSEMAKNERVDLILGATEMRRIRVTVLEPYFLGAGVGIFKFWILARGVARQGFRPGTADELLQLLKWHHNAVKEFPDHIEACGTRWIEKGKYEEHFTHLSVCRIGEDAKEDLFGSFHVLASSAPTARYLAVRM